QRRTELPLTAEVVGERVHVVVDAFTSDERFDNGLESTVTLSAPGAAGPRQELALARTAPGRYEAWATLPGFGAYVLEAAHARRGADGSLRAVAVGRGEVSLPYPREYARLEADVGRLEALARAGGGEVDPRPEQVVAAGADRVRADEPLWYRVALAAMGLLVLDLAMRRVPRRRRARAADPAARERPRP
ncbi:MAG: hypothetical protein FJ104_13685, partial [Deltaproteobacteria bacterium]|nr:hypothetical protein [Deltaproteobacteria bacterium]